MAVVIAVLFTGISLSAPQAAGGAAPIEPDVAIRANVRADSIRWRQAGALRIDAHAEPGGLEIEESLATGIPAPIPVGRTFRDVEWRLDVSTRIDPDAVVTAPIGSASPTSQNDND